MKAKSLRRQRGAISLLEITIALAITTAIQVAAIPALIQRAEQITTDVTIQEIFTLQDAVNLYFDQRGSFPDQAGNCSNAQNVVDELILQGYLANFNLEVPWGTNIQTACVVGGANPDRFTVTVEAPEERLAQEAASKLIQSRVVGSGPFSVESTLLGAGIPGFRNLLHRVAVPGQPELNRMETDLDMNNNDILNINRFVAQTIETNQLTWGNPIPSGERSLLSNDRGAIELNSYMDFHFNDPMTDPVNNPGARARDFDARFVTNGVGSLQVLASAIQLGSASSDSLRVDAASTFNAPAVFNALLDARSAIRWANSRLDTEEGGNIELGGQNAAGGNIAGTGAPYVDFHFLNLTEDYNVRLWNRLNGVMTVDAEAVEATRDMVVRRNLEVGGIIGASDVVLESTNRSLGQSVNSVFKVNTGDTIPKPVCPSPLVPQVYAMVADMAEGPIATPIYQVRTFATDLGSSYRVDMVLVTDNGIVTPQPGFGRMVTFTKCE